MTRLNNKRASDSFTEDIVVDLDRVARDYAVMRLEYLKYSSAGKAESISKLMEIENEFKQAQKKVLSPLNEESRRNEKKVAVIFNRVFKETKALIEGKSDNLVPVVKLTQCSVPAPRTRRQLSAELTDNISSPATPTKKKGGKLAAKPILDNIDENAPISSPKPTRRRSVARDDVAEDKALTPARRSVRIRSNTSITSETNHGFESPRALRASRRNSIADGENESTVTTPVKATRRTRKDSASSIETGGENAPPSQPVKQLTEVITVIEEEPENTNNSNGSNDENISPVRKSLRLLSKPRKSFADSPLSQTKTNKKTENTPSKTKANKISENTQPKTNANKITESSPLQTKKPETPKTYSGPRKSKTPNKSPSEKSLNADEQKSPSLTDESQQVLPVTKTFTDQMGNPVTCTVYIDESSNKSSQGSISNTPTDADDQCVPVSKIEAIEDIITPEVNTAEQLKHSLSVNTVDACEPMDIDETLPENISVSKKTTDVVDSSNNVVPKDTILETDSTTSLAKEQVENETFDNYENKSQQSKQSLNSSKSAKSNKSMEKSQNRSKNESSLNVSNKSISKDWRLTPKKSESEPNESSKDISQSHQEQNNNTNSKNISVNKSKSSGELEKSINENKSTLILSRINDEANLTKSPKVNNKSSEDVSVNVSKPLQTKNISNINSAENTPLKDKNLKHIRNLGMQTSTPVTAEANSKKITKSANKNDTLTNSKAVESDVSDESDSDAMSNDFINFETKDAGDDYRSGDSQDEDERQYEEENEIVERGETLNSEDDASDDTSYEKDSFVVSSNEEDNELLDGSGDDLNMSDNELTMSAKSKKKYNERKLKEQKSASREMYEARHKNKSLYDSSSSEEEEYKPKKKNNRLRLDSSVLASEDDSVSNISKSKRKNSINSSMNLSVAKEAEITDVCDESMLRKNDPLKVDVKREPKTPNNSMFNCSLEPINNVIVNGNATLIQGNETSDPLQDDEDSKSLGSENQEIMNNYDSMLNNLNDMNQKEKSKKSVLNKIRSDEDSIDLKLLFPDEDSDSNNEEDAEVESYIRLKTAEAKKRISTVSEAIEEQKDTSIGKENIDTDEQDDITNFDTKNKKNKQLSLSLNEDSASDSGKKKKHKDKLNTAKKLSQSLNIDTIGSDTKHSSNKSNADTELKNTSISKKHNAIDENESPVLSVSSEANCMSESVNTSISKRQTDKNESLNRSSKAMNQSVSNENIEINEDNLTESMNTSISKINKDTEDTILNQSQSSGKKNKKRTSIVIDADQPDGNINKHKTPESSFVNSDTKEENETGSVKNKKQKSKHIAEQNEHFNEIISANEEIDMFHTNAEPVVTGNAKKNKKNKTNTEDIISDNYNQVSESVVESSDTGSKDASASKKKKKKKIESEISVENEVTETEVQSLSNNDNSTENNSKKKKKKSTAQTELEDFFIPEIGTEIKTIEKSKKKKNKNSFSETVAAVADEIIDTVTAEDVQSSKKRKRRSSGEVTTEKMFGDSSETNAEQKIESKVKKIKKDNSKEKLTADENVDPDNQNEITESQNKKKKDKKMKKLSCGDGDNEISESNSTEEIITRSNEHELRADTAIVTEEISQKRKRNKRKQRDDDIEQGKSKAFKENYLDNVHVHRLPADILDKLDKENKGSRHISTSKTKVISTTNFIVEEGKIRKNKPSQYLEESVYLDSDSPDKKNTAPKIKKPKVLPFVPTASTSGNGFTSTFKVNIIPTEAKFIAQTSNTANFKNDYLFGKNIKRMGTYELYKKQRTLKLSKF